MSADYKVQRLYDEFIRDVTKSADNWKNFLRITGRIYRYEFDNVLMVYAQRPNATLVGDYDSWKKVGRYVKRGSRGIAIFPSNISVSDAAIKIIRATALLSGKFASNATTKNGTRIIRPTVSLFGKFILCAFQS